MGIPYDGCDDNCNIMSNFICNISNQSTICSYNGNISAKLIKI